MRLRLLLTSFFASILFFWPLNMLGQTLEGFFFARQILYNPQLASAQASQIQLAEKMKTLLPFPDHAIEKIGINAKSALALDVRLESELDKGRQKILFKKNIDEILPIASLSKLMTGLIVMDNYNLAQEVEISERAMSQKEERGELKAGETLIVKDLLDILLIESSNDAAMALAEVIGESAFLDLMNLTAKDLGLANTFFINPTGLDPEEAVFSSTTQDLFNYSTSQDFTRLIINLLKNHRDILEVTTIQETDLYLKGGVLHHHLKNTNQLLGELNGVVGGKTGYTDQAGGCLILIIKNPYWQDHYWVTIILGSEDRFGEMRKLITWARVGYKW